MNRNRPLGLILKEERVKNSQGDRIESRKEGLAAVEKGMFIDSWTNAGFLWLIVSDQLKGQRKAMRSIVSSRDFEYSSNEEENSSPFGSCSLDREKTLIYF